MKKDLVCCFNIIANDYLPQQYLFAREFKKNNKNIDLYCISLENEKYSSDLFETILINSIEIKNLEFLKFKYNPVELSAAVRPYIFSWFFKHSKYNKIFYFDSDIIVYKTLDNLVDKLSNSEVILTPHIRKPIFDDKEPNEISFIKSGYFNLGFIGFKKNKSVLEFVDWWSDKTSKYCYIDFNKHYFFDQRWIDYAPIFLNAHIIKEPGYNTSYFNLQEYIGKVNPSKVTFMHFSGFDKDKLSIYQNRFNTESVKEYSSFYKNYYSELQKYKQKFTSTNYKYDYFDNGVFISPYIKKLFLDSAHFGNILNFEKPFSAATKNSILAYLSKEHQSGFVINLIFLLYHNLPFLQEKFPGANFFQLNYSSNLYISWFVNEAKKELQIDEYFINRQKQILSDKEDVINLHLSYFQKNHFKRIFLRYKYFFKIILIEDKIKFANNLYLFLLGRNIDTKSLQDVKNNNSTLEKFKENLLKNIINSSEFLSFINSGKKLKSDLSIRLIKYNYMMLYLLSTLIRRIKQEKSRQIS